MSGTKTAYQDLVRPSAVTTPSMTVAYMVLRVVAHMISPTTISSTATGVAIMASYTRSKCILTKVLIVVSKVAAIMVEDEIRPGAMKPMNDRP